MFSFLSPARVHRLLIIAGIALGIGGCASKPLATFQDGRPIFKPEKFFAGRTHSWGIIETPSGKPTQILRTETRGHWEAGIFHFEQDVTFEHGKKQHRSWLIRRLDEHHYSATGTGIVGTARGEAWGNTFQLNFTMAVLGGNPFGHVHMSQWMYLQEGGLTMINRATVTKAGIVLAEVTEQFRKSR